MKSSTRVNLAISLELAILIEKECEKRGVNRTQLIKEILYEKIQKDESNEASNDLKIIKDEVNEIKTFLMLLIELMKNK